MTASSASSSTSRGACITQTDNMQHTDWQHAAHRLKRAHALCRYDRLKCELKHVKDMQLLASLAPPGGGRSAFSQRVMSCFSMLCVTAPNDAQLRKIYSALLSNHLSDFEDVVKPLGESITAAAVEIHRNVARELLPTPSKSHYLFNTRCDLLGVTCWMGAFWCEALRGSADGKHEAAALARATLCTQECVRGVVVVCQCLCSKR